jgi:hypothetical protein
LHVKNQCPINSLQTVLEDGSPRVECSLRIHWPGFMIIRKYCDSKDGAIRTIINLVRGWDDQVRGLRLSTCRAKKLELQWFRYVAEVSRRSKREV